jgi:hypothetical protein
MGFGECGGTSFYVNDLRIKLDWQLDSILTALWPSLFVFGRLAR